jgi:hypothetical protein
VTTSPVQQAFFFRIVDPITEASVERRENVSVLIVSIFVLATFAFSPVTVAHTIFIAIIRPHSQVGVDLVGLKHFRPMLFTCQNKTFGIKLVKVLYQEIVLVGYVCQCTNNNNHIW